MTTFPNSFKVWVGGRVMAKNCGGTRPRASFKRMSFCGERMSWQAKRTNGSQLTKSTKHGWVAGWWLRMMLDFLFDPVRWLD